MCWAVCSGAPHWQAADGRSPHRCMAALNRPTPVRIRFNDTHSLLGRFAPGGTVVLGVISSWAGRGVSCQLALHVWQMLKSDPSLLHGEKKGDATSVAADPETPSPQLCREVGCSGYWRPWLWSSHAGEREQCLSTGRNAVGVGRRHCNQPHGVVHVSSFLAWELLIPRHCIPELGH